MRQGDVSVARMWLARTAIRKGVTHFQKTHIIGDKFGGDPISENLFPGYSRMNLSGMKSCESKMRQQLNLGNPVLYCGKVFCKHSEGRDPGRCLTM